LDQQIISAKDNYAGLDKWIYDGGVKKILLVCGKSIYLLKEFCKKIDEIEGKGVEVVRFHGFQPNPLYENVLDGLNVFNSESCDSIIAVGGGSAMDVAKCIKLYSEKTDIPFLVMPTTAGTGSEATRFAVIYRNGEKQSITDDSIIPQTVLMDSKALSTLPDYQKKAAMCDALCHAIESYWSVKSTEESKEYSRDAIRRIIRNIDGYLSNTEDGLSEMLIAANIAGKAINITQTTAGHAMCYKITSLFNIPHGHATILCNRVLYRWMLDNTSKCSDERGQQYLKGILDEIGIALGASDGKNGAKTLEDLFEKLELGIPAATPEQFEILKKSVNPDRLKNFPIDLDEDTIAGLYHIILR